MTNTVKDIYVRDRQLNLTRRVSISSTGGEGAGNTGGAEISANGRFVTFYSVARNMVPQDTEGWGDTFLRDRVQQPENNSIVLSSSFLASVNSPLELSWAAAPPNSHYWLAYSLNQNGGVFGGHQFDLGTPFVLFASGTHTSDGNGHYSAAVPSPAAGNTAFFEVIAKDGLGILYESILQEVIFF